VFHLRRPSPNGHLPNSDLILIIDTSYNIYIYYAIGYRVCILYIYIERESFTYIYEKYVGQFIGIFDV
jgi:hypothetical protein